MSPKSSAEQQPPFLLLGRVLRPHGVRGEVRIEVLTAYPERIVAGRQVFVGPNPQDRRSATQHTVTRSHKHKNLLILQFEGIEDREAADALRGQFVMVTLENAVPLAEGELYLFQLIGLAVYTDEGEHLGRITDVIETGANDVYVVHGAHGEVLLPAIDECILELDIQGGKVTVHLLEGLL